MLKWIRRLIGREGIQQSTRPYDRFIDDYDSESFHSPIVTRYYDLSEEISRAKADRDYPRAIRAARETFSILNDFVRETMREDDGVFANELIRAIDDAGPMMAVMGDREAIAEMAAAIEGTDGLEEWSDAAEWTLQEADLVEKILEVVVANPGLKQKNLKAAVGASDARRLATVVRWLEDANRLVRVRVGSTYELHPEGTHFPSPQAATDSGTESGSPEVSLQVGGDYASRKAKRPSVVSLTGLPYLRLPKAPAVWEEREARAESRSEAGADTTDLFMVEGADWVVDDPKTLAKEEKPDPSFKRMFFTSGQSYALDPRGRSPGHEHCPAILRATDRAGALRAERGLTHDVYREDVNIDGSGILFLSREAVLHGYDDTLSPLLAMRIGDLPEYRAASKRLEISDHQKKNHIRCVALSNDTRRFLFTVVDEAWCVGRNGEPVWGLQMPTPEEWIRCSSRTESVGTDLEIANALKVMSLELPVSAEDVTRAYKRIAIETHPDRNPAPDAVEKMQDLNVAMDLLTGADLSDLSLAATETVTYEKIVSHQRVDYGQGFAANVEVRMVVSESVAADWIYAADFAARDDSAYIAGYSGRVIAIASDGTPKRVYDIGAVPRRIVDTGEHLYILTDTRLYVLSEDRLEALVDVFEQGDLLVAEQGFALLETKSLTWFSPNGVVEGRVRARDPIRRLFSTAEGIVIETRRHRTLIRGAPSWWIADASQDC